MVVVVGSGGGYWSWWLLMVVVVVCADGFVVDFNDYLFVMVGGRLMAVCGGW